MFNFRIIYQIWVNKYTSADELLCLCIAQRELVSFSLTEVLLQKQHITSTILALIIQISIIWTSHIYFWLITGSGYLIIGKWTDKSYGNPIVYLTTHKIPQCNGNGNVIRNILPTRNSKGLFLACVQLNEWEVCPTLCPSINQLNIRIISIRMSHWGVRTTVGYFSWCQGMVCRARKISSIFFRSLLYICFIIGQFLRKSWQY